MNKLNYTNINKESYFSEFINIFNTDDGLQKPSARDLKRFEDVLPKELLSFWDNYGFGNYGRGIIKVINPIQYMGSLYEWLGSEDILKIPILMTAFGDIFYYRKLDEDIEDVCLLNIHYRNCIVCSYSVKEFFNSYIVNENIYPDLLKKDLFEKAYELKGVLKENEIYFFTPALVLGGHESLEFLDKGDACVHQDMLFQLEL